MSDRKYGCLPALIPAGLRELGYYSAGALPKAPASVAVPDVADWLMLDNGPDPTCSHEPVGDCGVAGLQHLMMGDAAITSETETFPDADEAVAYYLSYTGGQDTGVVLSQYLQHVRQAGYYGHTVSAYAPVGVHDVPTLQTAIYLYGAAYTGIVVTGKMQEAFGNGQSWNRSDLIDSPVEGGHCVPVLGYDDTFLYAITWGAVQPITYPMWHYISTEAWCVMTGELDNGDGRGVNYQALVSDLDSLAS